MHCPRPWVGSSPCQWDPPPPTHAHTRAHHIHREEFLTRSRGNTPVPASRATISRDEAGGDEHRRRAGKSRERSEGKHRSGSSKSKSGRSKDDGESSGGGKSRSKSKSKNSKSKNGGQSKSKSKSKSKPALSPVHTPNGSVTRARGSSSARAFRFQSRVVHAKESNGSVTVVVRRQVR